MPLKELSSGEEVFSHYREVRERLEASIREHAERLARPKPPAPLPPATEPPLPRKRVRSFASLTMKERISQLIVDVAAFYQLPADALLSTRKTNKLVVPRQIAIYLARELSDASTPELGRMFRRDHSTVHHAVQRVRELMQLRPALRIQVCYLRAALEPLLRAKMRYIRIDAEGHRVNIIEAESFDAAKRCCGLEPLKVDHGTVVHDSRSGDGIGIVVDEFGLFKPPINQFYFALGAQLFAGNALVYAYEAGEAVDVDSRRALIDPRWFNTAQEVEDAIRRGEIQRPTVKINSRKIWAWPEQPAPYGCGC